MMLSKLANPTSVSRCRRAWVLYGAIFLVTGLTLQSSFAAEPSEARLSDRTTIEFASVEQGKELIGRVDEFLSQTGELERKMRLLTNEPVSVDRLIQSMQAEVQPWKEEEKELLSKIIDDLASDLKDYDLPLPERIYLVRVSSAVEADMPHCREASIVLPDHFFGRNSPQKRILAHELFHVLSSHNPELRDKLYAIIGFVPCNEIVLPDSLVAKRLTNPDAPKNRHVIELQRSEGESFFAVPVVTLRADRYTTGTFIQYINFGLMVVEKNDRDVWSAKVEDGNPELIEHHLVPDFTRKVGRNTRYVLHPEETLADNFAMLVLGINDVPDPWVMEKMQGVLMAK